MAGTTKSTAASSLLSPPIFKPKKTIFERGSNGLATAALGARKRAQTFEPPSRLCSPKQVRTTKSAQRLGRGRHIETVGKGRRPLGAQACGFIARCASDSK